MLRFLRNVDWRDVGRDIHAYGGLSMIAAGLYLYNPAWALLGIGVLLFYLGVWRMG